MKPFFPGGTAGFGWMPEMGEPSGVCNEAFHAGIGPFQVGPLRTFLTCRDNEFPRAGDPGGKRFLQARNLGIVKTLKIIQVYTQGNLGIDLVDVLAARAAGTGKIGPGGRMN